MSGKPAFLPEGSGSLKGRIIISGVGCPFLGLFLEKKTTGFFHCVDWGGKGITGASYQAHETHTKKEGKVRRCQPTP